MAVDVNERLLIYFPFTCFCVLYIKLYVRLTVETSVVRLHTYLKVLTFRLTSTFFSISLSFAGNSGRLTWSGRQGSRKSSTARCYQLVQCFRVSKHCYGCHCLGFLMCAQILIYVIIIISKAHSLKKSPKRFKKNLMGSKGECVNIHVHESN